MVSLALVCVQDQISTKMTFEAGMAIAGWLGYVHATKAKFEIAIYLPPSVCWRLGGAMASGLARSMLTNGPIEARGMNRITSATFR